MKKLISILLIICVMFTFVIPTNAVNNNITVIINGKTTEFTDVKPFIQDGRTLVPIRFISEELGSKVDWDEKNKKINIIKDNTDLEMIIGKKNVLVSNKDIKKEIELDVSPSITNNRTFVPLRFITEAFNAEIEWINETKTIVINTQSDNKISEAKLSESVVAFDDKKSDEFIQNIKSTEVIKNGNSIIEIPENIYKDLTISDNKIFFLKPTAKNPYGYMAKIVSSETKDGVTRLELSNPLIDEVFSSFSIDTSKKITYKDIKSTSFIDGVSLKNTVKNNYIAATEGFNLGEILKSFYFGNKDSSDITLGIKDAKIYSKVLKDNISKNLILNGTITFKDMLFASKIELEKYGIPKKFYTKLNSTIDTKISLTGEIKDSVKLNKLMGNKTNKTDLMGLSIEGLEEEDKIVLGNMSVDLGTLLVSFGTGEPIPTPLCSSILLTLTYSGEISASLSLSANYNAYLETGFDAVRDGTNIKTDFYKIFADGSYPNPNTNPNIKPTESQINSTPKWEYKAEVKGEYSQNLALGFDVALYMSGITPVKLANDLYMNSNISGEGSFGSDGVKGNIKKEQKVGFKSGFKARLKAESLTGLFGPAFTIESEKTIIDREIYKEKSEEIKKNTYGNSQGNLSSGAFVAEDKDWIYMLLSKSIIKVNKKTNEKILILGNRYFPSQINLDDNCLYFTEIHNNINSHENSYIFYSIRKDGLELKEIGTGSSSMWIMDDWIYYISDDYKLYKMGKDGRNKSNITNDKISKFYLDGDWIYYINQDDLKSYTFDNPFYDMRDKKETKKLGKIYKININGSNKMKVTDVGSNFCIVNNGNIYYDNADDGQVVGTEGDFWYDGKVYSMDTSGKNNKKITDIVLGDVQLYNNFIIGFDWMNRSLDIISNKSTSKVEEDIEYGSPFNILDDYIYYSLPIMSKKIYRYNLLNSNKEIFIIDTDSTPINEQSGVDSIKNNDAKSITESANQNPFNDIDINFKNLLEKKQQEGFDIIQGGSVDFDNDGVEEFIYTYSGKDLYGVHFNIMKIKDNKVFELINESKDMYLSSGGKILVNALTDCNYPNLIFNGSRGASAHSPDVKNIYIFKDGGIESSSISYGGISLDYFDGDQKYKYLSESKFYNGVAENKYLKNIILEK